LALLEERARLLEEEVESIRSHMDDAVRQGVARLFLIEVEHEVVLREAELRWVRELAYEIETGTLGGMAKWRSFHTEPETTGVEQQGKGSDR
jgi:hypothetical protein